MKHQRGMEDIVKNKELSKKKWQCGRGKTLHTE